MSYALGCIAMGEWNVSWKEIYEGWTTNQFNMFVEIWGEQQAFLKRKQPASGRSPRLPSGRPMNIMNISEMPLSKNLIVVGEKKAKKVRRGD